MTITLRTAALALAVVFTPGLASAATLGLSVASTPQLDGAGRAFNETVVGLGFFFDATGGMSSDPAAASGLDISIVGDFGGPLALNVGVMGTSEVFLSGLSTAVGSVFDQAGEDRIEIRFGSVGGTASRPYGSDILAILTGEFGTDQNALSFDFNSAATLTVNPIAPIPLPAAGPMLLLAMGTICIATRSRARRHQRPENPLG